MAKKSWAKVENYRDLERRELVVFTPFDKNDGKIIRGICTLKIKAVHSQTKQVIEREQRFEFGFPQGTTLKKAMDTFDNVAEAAIAEYEKKQKERQKEKQIVAARQMPPILGPGGNPFKPHN